MPNVDTDDLLDSGDVATMLGLGSPKAVSVYRRRYPDFPAPAVEKSSGKCVLWLRQDIEAWAAKRSGASAERLSRPSATNTA